MKSTQCTFSSRAFQQYQECGKSHDGFKDLNLINKITKLLSFMDRLVWGVFQGFFWVQRTSFIGSSQQKICETWEIPQCKSIHFQGNNYCCLVI
jgi:hypothetical protein